MDLKLMWFKWRGELKENNFLIKELKVIWKMCINFKMREINVIYYIIKEFVEKIGIILVKY